MFTLLFQVNVSWSSISEWTEWTYVCDSGDRYRYRQCPGSNPRAYTNDGIVKPPRTPQYGGERDCDTEHIDGHWQDDTRQRESRSQPYCKRKQFYFSSQRVRLLIFESIGRKEVMTV